MKLFHKIKVWLSDFPAEHRALTSLIYFTLFGLLSSFLFYIRFPNNFIDSNFYAEDGTVFIANILETGLLSALLTTFNGYFVWGLYLIGEIAIGINLFLGGTLLTLPQALSISSYIFLGFSCALPVLLFRKHVSLSLLAVVTLAGSLVPLQSSDYAIIGTLGNLKWMFSYLAFLLVIYRLLNTNASWVKLATIDIAILICAYTSAITYFLLPLLIIPYVKVWLRNKKQIKPILKDPTFLSLITLYLAVIPQIIIVALYGIPKLPGYLDSPFDSRRWAEIFIGRSFIHAFTYPIYKSLNSWLIALSGLIFLFLLYIGRSKTSLLVSAVGIYSVILCTGLFVLNRPGISTFFSGYVSSGPDQFFYAQNLIVYTIIIFALSALINKSSKKLRYIIPSAAGFLLLIAAPSAGSWGANNLMADNVDTFANNAVKKCQANDSARVGINVYPTVASEWVMHVDRSEICPLVANRQPTYQSLGLAPDNNNHLAIIRDGMFLQTFTPSQSNLSGVRLFLSTFGRTLQTDYSLEIYDAQCREKLRSAKVPLLSVKDNGFTKIHFEPIEKSKNVRLCMSLKPTENMATPLAVQISKADIYTVGQLTLNGTPSDKDIVFDLIYLPEKQEN